MLANDFDGYIAGMTATLDSPPGHGTLNLTSSGYFTYTPDPGYTGPDSFDYTAGDGIHSDSATVDITVFNNPPEAEDDLNLFTISHNASVSRAARWSILTNDSDPENDVLTPFILSQPQHGTLDTFNSNGYFYFTYTPDPEVLGTDSFTYTVSDGIASDSAIVEINVTNLAPVANAGYAISIPGGSSLQLNGSSSYDIDGDDLTYEWDLNGDGTADATGKNPTVDWAALYDLGFRQGENQGIELTVSDGFVEDTDTVNIGVSLPYVSISPVAKQDLKEDAVSPQAGSITFHRTGALDDSLTVNYSIGGRATAGTDYVPLTGSVIIPEGEDSYDLSVSAVNDNKVEGTETIRLAVTQSGDYTFFQPQEGTLDVLDNDYWQWRLDTGTPIDENDDKFQYVPGFDSPLDYGAAKMNIHSNVGFANNIVSADLWGAFQDTGMTEATTDNYLIQSTLDLQFGFDASTGDITETGDLSSDTVQDVGPLSVGIGYDWTIDNEGDNHHSVTIHIVEWVTVTGTIGTTGTGTPWGVGLTWNNQQPSGGRLKLETDITLHLDVVEHNISEE